MTNLIMNYKKRKYYRQNVDLNKIISKATVFLIFQLKSINISNWFLLKKELKIYGFCLKVCPIKLFKNNNLVRPGSKLLKNVHNGNILIVYLKTNKSFDNSCIKIFEKNPFLIVLYVFYMQRFFFFDNFQKLFQKNNHIDLIYTISQTCNLIRIFDKIKK